MNENEEEQKHLSFFPVIVPAIAEKQFKVLTDSTTTKEYNLRLAQACVEWQVSAIKHIKLFKKWNTINKKSKVPSENFSPYVFISHYDCLIDDTIEARDASENEYDFALDNLKKFNLSLSGQIKEDEEKFDEQQAMFDSLMAKGQLSNEAKV